MSQDFSSKHSPNTFHHTAAIILAAGASKRLGHPKQLATYQGQTLLERTVSIALKSSVGEVMVVLGAKAKQCQTVLESYPVKIVSNPRWKEGISSSIKAGIVALDEIGALAVSGPYDSALFLACDQPFLSVQLIDELLEKFHANNSKIIASAYLNCRGIPTLFDKALFPELLKLNGDRGAGSLIKKYQDIVIAVQFPRGEVDIDTSNDHAELCETERSQ